ncbi:MAG: hypothetical protein ACRDS0_29380 [Pseudonocardiaceae bacterium]
MCRRWAVELAAEELASSSRDAGCDGMIAYCLDCLDKAARCNADTGLVDHPHQSVVTWSPDGWMAHTR